VTVLADESTELIGLGGLGNGNSAGVKVCLQSAVGPSRNGLVESLLSSQGGIVGGLGILVASLAGSSSVGTGGSSTDGITEERGAALANKSAELVGLGALGNGDTVLVGKLLELRLAPGVNDLVGQSGIGSIGTGGSRRSLVLRLQVGDARVAADRGDELVTSGG